MCKVNTGSYSYRYPYAQYHDNIELYKEWFGEDNIENIKDKIIESAIVNWFEDEDAGIEKVWNYFRAI